jgi:hypothetical protein
MEVCIDIARHWRIIINRIGKTITANDQIAAIHDAIFELNRIQSWH